MKRGSSGLSLIVGINKPVGPSSHDMVNCARRIFKERRCGHTGTLDPLASGVLPICVGPATRLDRYMTGHDKRYRVRIAFGYETTTDDAAGEPTVTGPIPGYLFDAEFAHDRMKALIRDHAQTPPQYSAIKVGGKKAYEVARSGGSIELEPRIITVYDAELVDILEGHDDFAVQWIVDFFASKGTYIRSLVRDLGREVLCPAHVEALERTEAGALSISQCVTPESLEVLGTSAALDPISILGFRYAFADDFTRFVTSGTPLFPNQVELYEPLTQAIGDHDCPCTSHIRESAGAPAHDELAALIIENRLKALYRFDANQELWKPDCVFSTSIFRG